MADVFVSYHRDNRDDAERYAEGLRRLGYSVFWNQDDLPVGSSDRLAELDEARFVLVLWTHSSTEARQIFVEASDAEQFGRYIGIAIEDRVPLARRFAEHCNTKVIDPTADYCDVVSLTGFVGLILDLAQQEEAAGAKLDPRKVSAALKGTVEPYFKILEQEEPAKLKAFLEFIERGADLEWLVEEQLQTVSKPLNRIKSFALNFWRELGFATATAAAVVAIFSSKTSVDVSPPTLITEAPNQTESLPLGPGYYRKIVPAGNGRQCEKNFARFSGLCLSTDITELRLSERLLTRASNLSQITKFGQLQILDVSGIPTSDLSPLSEMRELRELILRNTEVADITPIAGLTNLQKLDLRGSKVTDISPAFSIGSLGTICLADSEFCSNLTVDRLMPHREE